MAQSGQIKIKHLPNAVPLKPIPTQTTLEPTKASKSPFERHSAHFSAGSDEWEQKNSFSTPEKKVEELKDLQAELELLSKTHVDLHKNIEELRTNLKLAKNENDQLRAKVNEITQDNDQKDSEISTLQKLKAKLEEELETTKKELKNTGKLAAEHEQFKKENEILTAEMNKLREALAASEDEGNARVVLFSIEIERLHGILMEKLQQNDELEDALEELTKLQEEKMKYKSPVSRARQEKLKNAEFPSENSEETSFQRDSSPNEVEALKKSVEGVKNSLNQIDNQQLLQEGAVKVLMMIEIDRLQEMVQNLSQEKKQLELQCQVLKDHHAREIRELLDKQEKLEAANLFLSTPDKRKQEFENIIKDLHEDVDKLKRELAEKNSEVDGFKSKYALLEKKYYNDLFNLQKEMEVSLQNSRGQEDIKSGSGKGSELLEKLLNSQKTRIDELDEITNALHKEMSEAKKEGALRGVDAEKWKIKADFLEKRLKMEGISSISPPKKYQEILSDVSRESPEMQAAVYRQWCENLQDKIAKLQEKEQEYIKENFAKEIEFQNLKNRYDVLDHDYKADRERQKGEFEYFLYYHSKSPALLEAFREFWMSKPMTNFSSLSQEVFSPDLPAGKETTVPHANNYSKAATPSASNGNLQYTEKTPAGFRVDSRILEANYLNRGLNQPKPPQPDRSGREGPFKYQRDDLQISVSPQQREAGNNDSGSTENKQAYPLTTTATSTQYKPYVQDYTRKAKTPTPSDSKNATIPKFYSPEKPATSTSEKTVLADETTNDRSKFTKREATDNQIEGQLKLSEKPRYISPTYAQKYINTTSPYNPTRSSGYSKPPQSQSSENIPATKPSQPLNTFESNQISRSTERVPYSSSLILPNPHKGDSSPLVNSQTLKSPTQEAYTEIKAGSSYIPSRNNRFNSNPQAHSVGSVTRSTEKFRNPEILAESFVSEVNPLTIAEKQAVPSYTRIPENSRVNTHALLQSRTDQERLPIRSTANERSISEGPSTNPVQSTQNVSIAYLKKLQATEIRFIVTCIELERVLNLLRKEQANSLYNSNIGFNELQKSQNEWNHEKGTLLKQIQAQRSNLKEQDTKIRELYSQLQKMQDLHANLLTSEKKLQSELEELKPNQNLGSRKGIMRELTDQGIKFAEENGILDAQLREERLRNKDLDNKLQYLSKENERLNELIQERDHDLEKLLTDNKSHIFEIQDLHSQLAAEENKQQAVLSELRKRLDEEKEVELRQIATKLRGEHQSEIKRVKDELQQQLSKSPQKDGKIRELQNLVEQLTQDLQDRENETDELRKKLIMVEGRHQKEKEDQRIEFDRQLKAKVDSELRRLNNRMSLQKDSIETELQRAEDRCQELEKLLQDRNRILDDLTNESAEWAREADKWKRKCEQMERAAQLELTNLRDDYELNVKNQLQAKINEMSKSFEKERKEFNDSMKKTKIKVSDLELKGVMLMIEIERQVTENERLHQEVEEMREKEFETENLYQREVDEIKRQFEGVQARMEGEMHEAEKRQSREREALEGQIEHLKTRQGELERLIEELNGNNTKLSDEMLAARREKKGLIEKCNLYEDKKNDLENRILMLELERGRMDRERQQMSSEIESLERALNQANNDYEKKFAILNTEKKRLEDELDRKENTIKGLREQLDKEKHDLQKYTENLKKETEQSKKHETEAAVKAAQEKAQQEIDSIKRQLADANNELQEREKHIERLQQELERTTQNLNNKLKENEELHDQITGLHKDYKKKLQEQHESLTAEKETQIAEALAEQESAFEKERQKLNILISDLNNQIKNIAHERETKQAQINQLKQTIDKLTLDHENELADLQSKLDKDHSRKLDEIQKEYKIEKTGLETKIKEFRAKLREAEAENATLRDEIGNLKKTIEEKERDIELLTEELENSGSEKSAVIERLQNEIEASNQNIKNKQKEIEKLRDQNSDLVKEHKKKLQEQYDALVEEKKAAIAEALEDQQKIFEKEKQRLNSEIGDLNNQKQQLLNEKEGKQAQINELKAKLREAETENATLRDEIENLKKTIEEKERDIDLLTEELENSGSEKSAVIERLQNEIEASNQNIKNKQKEIEKLRDQNSDLVKEHKKKLQEQYDALVEEKKAAIAEALEDQQKIFEKEKQRLNSEIGDLNNQKQQLLNEKEGKQAQINELKQAIDQLHEEHSEALTSLRARLESESQRKIEELQKDFKSERTGFETRIKDLKLRVRELEDQNIELNAEVESLKKQNGDKMKEIEDLREELDKLEMEKDDAIDHLQSQFEAFRRSSVSVGDYEIRYKAEKSALESQLLELKGKLAQSEELNFTLQAEMKRLKESGGETSTTMLIKQKELQEKIEDIDRLKRKYEEALAGINMAPVISKYKVRESTRPSILEGKNSARKKSPEGENLQLMKELTQ